MIYLGVKRNFKCLKVYFRKFLGYLDLLFGIFLRKFFSVSIGFIIRIYNVIFF